MIGSPETIEEQRRWTQALRKAVIDETESLLYDERPVIWTTRATLKELIRKLRAEEEQLEELLKG